MTRRESQTFRLLAQAMSNKEIAKIEGNAEKTVEAYCYRLRKKLGARNRTQLAIMAATAEDPRDYL